MIRAEVHSDDFVFEAKFDAEPFFQEASEQQIIDLADCGWRGDYPADDVARHVSAMEDYAEVAAVLDYTTRKDEVGFECSVEKDDALKWIASNRPDILEKVCLACDEDILDYTSTTPKPVPLN